MSANKFTFVKYSIWFITNYNYNLKLVILNWNKCIDSFIQQGYITLIKSDKDIFNVTKKNINKNAVLLNFLFIKEKKIYCGVHKNMKYHNGFQHQ